MNATPPLLDSAWVQRLFEQAVDLHQRGRWDEAKALYQQILTLEPQHFDATHLMGLMACQEKNHALGLPLMKEAIAINPANPAPYANLGVIYRELKVLDQALVYQTQAIELDPRFAKAYFNRGNLYQDLKRPDLALQDYSQALALNPKDIQALINRAWLYFHAGEQRLAIADLERAVALDPQSPACHYNRGLLMTRLLRFDQALISYRRAFALKPEEDWVLGEMLYSELFTCEWSELSTHARLLEIGLEHHQKVSAPLIASSVLDSPRHLQIAAERWVAHYHPDNTALGPLPQRLSTVLHTELINQVNQGPSTGGVNTGLPPRKIKIAYLSADFRDHPVSLLMAELFELHDRSRFEVLGFDASPDNSSPKDALRNRLKVAFDEFISIKDLDDQAAAQLMRSKQLDIVVDLGGHTLNSRIGVLAYRVAPVQMSYIGYLGSLGAPYIDYVLADETLIPRETQDCYSEHILYLPCYQVNDRQRVVSDKLFSRSQMGLPERGFVFCCFNNNFKISPSTFTAWMNILRAVPESVLWLLADNPVAEVNLLNNAKHQGIDPQRLIFGQRMQASEYLARYKTADLFLDTWPYNAGTTASDALLVGLPVLTLQGQSFPARMASSVLMGLGLPELITETVKDYQDRAIALAVNPSQHQALREKVSTQQKNGLLFNSPAFTQSLERGMVHALERAATGLGPQTFHVNDLAHAPRAS